MRIKVRVSVMVRKKVGVMVMVRVIVVRFGARARVGERVQVTTVST